MTNFLYAQAPNRKGNQSKFVPKHESVSGGTAKLVAKGTQGAAKATGNPIKSNQGVMLSTPKCSYGDNSGYRGSENTFK